MTNLQSRRLKKIYKDVLKNVNATEQQLEFLLQNYIDEDYIIGIHNTLVTDYNCFFINGLHNRTSLGSKVADLSNAVFYDDIFAGLLYYININGKNKNNTSIILKIPKKVFLKEQGIFEELRDGNYGIPPEYIIGAFQGGNVIKNNLYNANYISLNAINCVDNIVMQNKKINALIFKNFYDKKNNNIKNRFLNFIQSLKNKNRNQLLLGSGQKIEYSIIKDTKQFSKKVSKARTSLSKPNERNYGIQI